MSRLLFTYNGMFHMLSEETKNHPLTGVPQNILRCPGCGRHTIYSPNDKSEEWCFHCDYSTFVYNDCYLKK